VAQDLPEIRALFGHGFGAGLAKPDAVSLAGSFQNDFTILSSDYKVIAGNGRPAKAVINVKPRGFVGTMQRGSILSGDSA